MRLIQEAVMRGKTAWQGLYTRVLDKTGQTLAEYGLIITVISVVGIVTAVVVFREGISAAFLSVVNCLDGSC